MHRLLLPAILAGCLLAPLAVTAEARPIIVVERGWHHGGFWGGPRWGPVLFPPLVFVAPPLVVPAVQYVPVPVAAPVAVPVPVPAAPSGCGCPP